MMETIQTCSTPSTKLIFLLELSWQSQIVSVVPYV